MGNAKVCDNFQRDSFAVRIKENRQDAK